MKICPKKEPNRMSKYSLWGKTSDQKTDAGHREHWMQRGIALTCIWSRHLNKSNWKLQTQNTNIYFFTQRFSQEY